MLKRKKEKGIRKEKKEQWEEEGKTRSTAELFSMKRSELLKIFIIFNDISQYLRSTSGHMNNSRSSKVDHTNTTERFVRECGQETIWAPDRMDNHRINLREEKRIAIE
jgi:hypothetical protein